MLFSPVKTTKSKHHANVHDKLPFLKESAPHILRNALPAEQQIFSSTIIVFFHQTVS